MKSKKFRWRAWLIASALCAVTVRHSPGAYESALPADMRAEAVQKGVYVISDFEDLKEFSKAVSLCEGAFAVDAYLVNDIHADGGFTPIGDALHRFEGTFDGCGYTIDGLRIEGKAEFQGLFGYVGNNGMIKNVTLRNVRISGRRYVGGIAAYSSGRLENCRVEWAQIIGRSRLDYGNAAGGIVGLSCGAVVRCSAQNILVSGERSVGGIAGSQHAQQMSLCISSGEVVSRHSGQAMAGGIAGSVQTGALIKGCVSLCAVYSPGQWTGGIVGSLQSGKMLGCMAVGKVEGSSAGGVAGYASPQAQLIRCLYIGNLPAAIGQGQKKGGVQVLRADRQQLERSRTYLAPLLEKAGFVRKEAG